MVSPLLVFINPKSGGGVGGSLINALDGKESCYIVKLPKDATTWQSTISSDVLHDRNLKIVVCGGDGSINWVISMLIDFYGKSEENRPPVSVIPLGTGNDMSRMLGWGTSYGNSDIRNINKQLKKIRDSKNVQNLDVWNLTSSRTDINEEKSKIMINYLSLGVDASVAKDFENCRNTCAWCFCCHCMSKALYGPVSLGSLCFQPKLKNIMSGSYKESDNDQNNEKKDFSFKNSSKTLILQNITYMYSGKDTWHSRDYERSISDHKLEVSETGGIWSLAGIQLGLSPTNNITQAGNVSFETNEPVAYQIDGEAFIVNGPAKFNVEYYASYPVLFA